MVPFQGSKVEGSMGDMDRHNKVTQHHKAIYKVCIWVTLVLVKDRRFQSQGLLQTPWVHNMMGRSMMMGNMFHQFGIVNS